MHLWHSLQSYCKPTRLPLNSKCPHCTDTHAQNRLRLRQKAQDTCGQHLSALFFSFDVDLIGQRHLAAASAPNKRQRQHGHTYLAPASSSHTLQRYKHPSFKAHAAIDMAAAPAAARTSTQAPKCKQATLPILEEPQLQVRTKVTRDKIT